MEHISEPSAINQRVAFH